jgi:hypothetical protein
MDSHTGGKTVTQDELKSAISNIKLKMAALGNEKATLEQQLADQMAIHKIGDILQRNTSLKYVVIAIKSRWGEPAYLGRLLKKNGELGTSRHDLYWAAYKDVTVIGHMEIEG